MTSLALGLSDVIQNNKMTLNKVSTIKGHLRIVRRFSHTRQESIKHKGISKFFFFFFLLISGTFVLETCMIFF